MLKVILDFIKKDGGHVKDYIFFFTKTEQYTQHLHFSRRKCYV